MKGYDDIASHLTEAEIATALATLGDIYNESQFDGSDYLSERQKEVAIKVVHLRMIED